MDCKFKINSAEDRSDLVAILAEHGYLVTILEERVTSWGISNYYVLVKNAPFVSDVSQTEHVHSG